MDAFFFHKENKNREDYRTMAGTMSGTIREDGRITGELVYIRPITRNDTDLIVNWRNNETVRPYFIYQKPFTREGHEKWLKEMIDSGKGFQFIVCEKNTDRPIGCTYLRDYNREHHKIEYGMFIGEKPSAGHGIGSEIVALTAKFAFEEEHIHKMFCRIFADNMASVKSCENGGFVQEAYLKEDVLVNGKYRDMVLLAMINQEQ